MNVILAGRVPTLSNRRHLGLLEKKKDYKLRAKDYHKKQDELKRLQQKALNKNPDEFYFKMINSRLEGGVHHKLKKDRVQNDAQVRMMNTQDLRYVRLKRGVEAKKIERLKSSLHMLDETRPKNKHTFFVDTKEEASNFDPAKHLNTHPALIGRTYNRPMMETLKKQRIGHHHDEEFAQEIELERRKKYKELSARIEREKQLFIIAQKMQTKQDIHEKRRRKVKVADETEDKPAVYKWFLERRK
ncbi:probable U3 small nucleolar RNA-associated protein 11 [Anneissia japonica]|uniref:probable U3 small nucleolar RNA-associated protein 11 n=1 Tax=Anneissia japonica TaxID=1529436 RepID=UPI001425A03D|nr:probable U3 small nucleolar RNA-associated protein 11 [Anneissia japonica]